MEPVLAMVRDGPTDEHRFVGLLMLPKLLGQLEAQSPDAAAADDQSPRQRSLAFAALDMGFLGRLLATTEGGNAAQMRAVALAVLAAFADEPRFGGAALVLAPRIAQAWAAEAQPGPVDQAVARDAASLLVGLSRSGEAALALAAAGGVAAALGLLVALDSRGREEDGGREQLDALLRRSGRALSELLTVAEVGARTDAAPGLVDSAAQAVASISAVLGATQSLLKFIALGLLAPSVALLQTACDTACTLNQPHASSAWVAQAREGLRSILGARVGASERYEGLLAVATLTDFLGADWLAASSSVSGGGVAPLRRLVVRLTSVEMQLLLEDDRSSEETQPQDSEVRPGDLLSVCLRLAEQAVLYAQSLTAPQYSGAGGDEMSAQEATDMAGECVRSAAQWAARLMAGEQTLAPLLAATHQPEAVPSSESGLTPEPEPEVAEQELRKVSLLLGGVRLIGCWAAAAEPQLELARLFPYFLGAAWTSDGDSKAGEATLAVQASEQSAFDFLYPALLQLSIVSPTSRQWLFGNFDDSETNADSAAAAVARQIVRSHNSGGPTVDVLDPRRLELLLNVLCLEHTIPPRVTAMIGSTVIALSSHLTRLMEGSNGTTSTREWGLAMAVVAAGVRLVRDSSDLRGSDDCLSDVTQPGCGLVLRWLAVTYQPAVESLEDTAGTGKGGDDDGEQLAEMYLLTSGVCCSLLDHDGTGNGSSRNRREFVAKALRDAARHSACAIDLALSMKAATKQPLRSLPVKAAEDEDEDEAVGAGDISDSLLHLAQLLSGPGN